MRYFDSSALVKGYVEEAGSRQTRLLLARGGAATTRLSLVEVATALGRLGRERRLSDDQRLRALAALAADADSMVLVELTGEVVSRATALTQKHLLRACDAIQLASCLYLRDVVDPKIRLVSFDDRLNVAARTEGVSLGATR